MKSSKPLLYRHCWINTIEVNNARLGKRYVSYIRLNDSSDPLKRTPLKTFTESSVEFLEVQVKSFIDDLPASLTSFTSIDFYKKFISTKKELIHRFQFREHWIEIVLASEPKANRYFFYQPLIELPHRGGIIITGDCYESFNEAKLAAVNSVRSWC